MMTQMHMQRMGPGPFSEMQLFKCKHLHLVSWIPLFASHVDAHADITCKQSCREYPLFWSSFPRIFNNYFCSLFCVVTSFFQNELYQKTSTVLWQYHLGEKISFSDSGLLILSNFRWSFQFCITEPFLFNRLVYRVKASYLLLFLLTGGR